MFGFLVSGFSQSKHASYTWEYAQYDTVKKDYELENSIVIFEKKMVELFFSADNQFRQIEILHKKVQLNSNDAIEEYNTIYLPASTHTKKVLDQKTRVITKQGVVKELDNSAIQVKQNPESGKTYKYYAIEGVEIGSQIEFYYITEDDASYNGNVYSYQDDEVKQNVTFSLVCPKHMFFAFHVQNNAMQPALDSLDSLDSLAEYNEYVGIDENVEKLESESFSNYSANRKRIIYKMDYFVTNSKTTRNVVSYGEIGQSIYSLCYSNVSKPENKAIQKIIKLSGVQDKDSEFDKIFKIENYLKKNIAIGEVGAYNIANGFSKKIMSSIGVLRTMVNCYKQLGITHEIVLTSDRNSLYFIDTFDSYVFLQEYLLYFPTVEKYLIPTEQFYRLGLIPHNYIYNKGLFLKEVSVLGYTTGAGEIKFIPAPSKDETYSKMYLNVQFQDDPTNVIIDSRNESYGYYSHAVQPYFYLLDEKTTRELQEELIKSISSDIEILSMEYQNIQIEDVGQKPMISISKFDASNFVESAGNKFLFKIGELIGPQMELYHDDSRKMPVENDFNRSYYREISFTLPEGYRVENLDDIIIDKKIVEEDGTISAQFVSNYTIENNVVTVISEEFYDRIQYPVEIYEEYRQVINAAADFNKVVFVFAKK